ncbi:carbonic anhydrase family protein [Acinetobacter variabilis]|uniref:carbonic anhydrase n=1 Tax=Acinetobacter variabilis TaxID=70346 RepID=UPI000F677E1E|nr:carbonic anhydrase family protein [Acinetobacter variabilis]QXR20844.1 carbonic anhydrase family protein [Acinetobacter variabilis]
MGLSTAVFADADWNYDQPEQWSTLNQKYSACNGLNQSPINIERTVKAELEPLKFSYNTMIHIIENKGHTVQVDFAQGGELQLDGETFVLKQFHLHSPSENLIKGKSYPLEIHFVHANTQGELAVVAMMFAQGTENPMLKRMWNRLPKKQSEKVVLKTPQPVNEMLPKNLDYYRFSGSLTTPPCSEGVRWLILKEIQQASATQISEFSKLMGHPNNRPVQSLNGRVVLE